MTETAIRTAVLCSICVPRMNHHSRPAIGTMATKMETITHLPGISCSVRSTCAPFSLVPREARSDSDMPRAIGPMILMSVQMAATAMTPAPMKRTSDLKTVDRAEVRSSAPSSWPFAYRGSRTP